MILWFIVSVLCSAQKETTIRVTVPNATDGVFIFLNLNGGRITA